MISHSTVAFISNYKYYRFRSHVLTPNCMKKRITSPNVEAPTNVFVIKRFQEIYPSNLNY